jgi:hypothetical protein
VTPPLANRPQTRVRVDDRLLLSLPARLTDRDRLLIRLLAEHQVLTTPQITDIGFCSQRRTESRLAQLYHLRVLDRFRPLTRTGSAPFHWLLDEAGAAVLAAEQGRTASEVGWRRDKTQALRTNQHLRHLVGTNGVFTALIRTARGHPDRALALWWPERRCAAEWGEVVRPDGYGIWQESGRRVGLLLEYDRGTEALGRLAGKLGGYTELLAAAGAPTPVLFVFLTADREAQARRVLTAEASRAAVPVATSVLTPGQSAADQVWLPLGGLERQLLIDLASPLEAARNRTAIHGRPGMGW